MKMMSKVLFAFLVSSTLAVAETPSQLKTCCCCTGPRGATGPKGETGPRGPRGKTAQPATPSVLYAFNNPLPNENTATYPFKQYLAGQNLLFDNVGKVHGSIKPVSLNGGTAFVFGEKGTYEVTVVVFLPAGIPATSNGGTSTIPPPPTVNDGSIQARINDATESSLPPTPAMPDYFTVNSITGEPIVYQFIHTIKKGERLTITPVSYLAVNPSINSCSIKIIRLY